MRQQNGSKYYGKYTLVIFSKKYTKKTKLTLRVCINNLYENTGCLGCLLYLRSWEIMVGGNNTGKNCHHPPSTERKNPMVKKHTRKDHELFIFSQAMELLVKASTLKYEPFSRNHRVRSIGIENYGTISTLERLAGAMNVKGYRTSQGKYLTATNLKKMKSTITKRYGHRFVADLVDWKNISQFPLDDALMERETKREIKHMNAVDYGRKNKPQKDFLEWWPERYEVEPETDRIMDRTRAA